jgi:hypothetical protein
MNLFRSKLFAAFAASLCLAACATAPTAAPTEIRQIVSTTSFGMCVGYCTTRLEISEGQAVLLREARGGRGGPQNLPDQRFTAELSASEWQEIARLAANTNLQSLPDVIGCPDCADGGAEALTINGGRTVTFDHGATVPSAQPLLDRVRALRERLMPEGG